MTSALICVALIAMLFVLVLAVYLAAHVAARWCSNAMKRMDRIISEWWHDGVRL